LQYASGPKRADSLAISRSSAYGGRAKPGQSSIEVHGVRIMDGKLVNPIVVLYLMLLGKFYSIAHHHDVGLRDPDCPRDMAGEH
jgi:hypothetical protein